MSSSTFLVLFSLLLLTECNAFLKSSPPFFKKAKEKCALCEETPCECEKLVLKDNAKKPIKKLILLVIKKSTASPENPTACNDCPNCSCTASQKQKLVNVLNEILKKASYSKEAEEQVIKNSIAEIIDSSQCEEGSCQNCCDPYVQKALKTILKKAAKCDCDKKPCDCGKKPSKLNRPEYQYWYKVTKATMRKEACKSDSKKDENDNSNSTVNKICPHDSEQVYNCKNTKISDRIASSKTCRKCQRPDNLICPRYATEDCSPKNENDFFSICTDCSRCRMSTGNDKKFVTLFCTDCKPIDTPFVEFTKTGCPFRKPSVRNCGLRVRTKYLQINDFRLGGETPKNCSYNPFKPTCNRPRKRKKKCKK